MHLFDELNKLGATIVIATHNETLVRKSGRPILSLKDGNMSVQEAGQETGQEAGVSSESDKVA